MSGGDVRKTQGVGEVLGPVEEEDDRARREDEVRADTAGKVPHGDAEIGNHDVLKQFPYVKRESVASEVQHDVELTRPFYVAVYDVTQAQYQAVTGKTRSNFKGTDMPVEMVSWDRRSICTEANGKTKDGLLYRLPTEAEWEYPCRGGRSSSFPFGIGDGTSLSSREANFDGNHPYGGVDKGLFLKKTTPVGTYKANALGLYDMQGNVWQWCSDWYGDYATGRVVNPEGPARALPGRAGRCLGRPRLVLPCGEPQLDPAGLPWHHHRLSPGPIPSGLDK